MSKYYLKKAAKDTFKQYPTEGLIEVVQAIKSGEYETEDAELLLKIIKKILIKRGENTDIIDL